MKVHSSSHFYRSFVLMALVFCLGSYMRLGSAAETVVIIPLRADALDYFSYAFNLRHHDVYSKDKAGVENPQAAVSPDALRAPGYPLFLVPFADRFPDSHVLGRIVISQALLSSLTVLMAYALFSALLPAGWAIAASFLTALCPHLIVVNSYLLTEALFTFLLLACALAIHRAMKGSSFLWYGIAGVLLAYASLTRPSIQFYPFVLPLLIFAQKGWKTGWRMMAVLLVAFCVAYSPWIVRNLISIGKISDPTLTINGLHHGLYPNFTFEGAPDSFGFPYRFDPRSDEISRSVHTALGEIARRFREEPARHLRWLLIGKPIYFWSWGIVQGMGDIFIYPVSHSPYFDDPLFRWTRLTMLLLHWPLVVLSLVVSVLVWAPRLAAAIPESSLWPARLLSSLILYNTALHMVVAPFPRYSMPLRPFTYAMGLFSLYLVIRLIRRHSRDTLSSSSQA